MTDDMPSTLLLDTCVWLDNYLGSRPGSAAAHGLIVAALKRDVPLMYAVTTVKDLHYIVAQTLARERQAAGEEITEGAALADNQTAWACVENMREIATAVGMDASDVWLAEKYRTLHHDIEDNLVIATAQRVKVGVLVTDDLELIRHAPVAAMTPEDALKLFEE